MHAQEHVYVSLHAWSVLEENKGIYTNSKESLHQFACCDKSTTCLHKSEKEHIKRKSVA